ncbi:hypothetical protein REPUB_Repub11eG0133900 [Reevesia pubescens]
MQRVVKEKLSDCSPDYDINVHKDAILAFSKSARIFIHYLFAIVQKEECEWRTRQGKASQKEEDEYDNNGNK